MTKRTKLLIFIAVDTLIILFFAAVLLLAIFTGDIVKTGINTFLPEITGTDSGIESCSVNLFSGHMEIKNFIIGNPDGYKTPYAFKLGVFIIDTDIGSLFSDTIRIKNVVIDNLEICYETNFHESNIGRIQENIKRFIEVNKIREKKKRNEASFEESEEATSKGKKFIIDKLIFKSSHLKADVRILNTEIDSGIPLPQIELTDIGKKSAGVTAAELTEQIINQLYKATLSAIKENKTGFMDNVKKQGKTLLNFFR